MEIKTRYTLFSFLKLFFIISISFLLMFLLIEIFENMKDAVKYGDKFNVLMAFYRLPSIFVEISPVLTFLSGMFLLGEMMKYGEVRILEISGIKPVKMLVVLFLCGFIISVLSFYVKNFTAPFFLKKIDDVSEVKIVNFSTPNYLLYSEKFIYPDTFEKVQFSEIETDGSILTVNALNARYLGDNLWVFNDGRMWFFNHKGELENSKRFESDTLNITLEPELIIDTSRNINNFSYVELRNMMLKLEVLNILPVPIQSSFHERFSYPLLNLSLLFLLFPFFYIKHKISRVFVLGISILLSFICYGIFSSGLTLARDGKIPVFLGVWLVHIFILSGVIVYLTISSQGHKTQGE